MCLSVKVFFPRYIIHVQQILEEKNEFKILFFCSQLTFDVIFLNFRLKKTFLSYPNLKDFDISRLSHLLKGHMSVKCVDVVNVES